MPWRIDGSRIYKVKGKRKSRKRTFSTKKSALAVQRAKTGSGKKGKKRRRK